MAYTTFLLDLDHTLFDTEASETAAFEQTMAAAGIADAASHWATYERINLSLWAAVERNEIQPQIVRTRRFELFVVEQELQADPLQMADDFVDGLAMHGDLYEGAREVLEHLSGRASLAMVTNGLSEVQRTRIERLGLDDYFDAIAISAELGEAKPGAGIFDFVFQSLNNPAKESAVMVGDNLGADIRGGTNYGIATAWYNPQGREAAATDQISHEIRDLQELVGFVV
jgi:2-haloacid dehalogenase